MCERAFSWREDWFASRRGWGARRTPGLSLLVGLRLWLFMGLLSRFCGPPPTPTSVPSVSKWGRTHLPAGSTVTPAQVWPRCQVPGPGHV